MGLSGAGQLCLVCGHGMLRRWVAAYCSSRCRDARTSPLNSQQALKHMLCCDVLCVCVWSGAAAGGGACTGGALRSTLEARGAVQAGAEAQPLPRLPHCHQATSHPSRSPPGPRCVAGGPPFPPPRCPTASVPAGAAHARARAVAAATTTSHSSGGYERLSPWRGRAASRADELARCGFGAAGGVPSQAAA